MFSSMSVHHLANLLHDRGGGATIYCCLKFGISGISFLSRNQNRVGKLFFDLIKPGFYLNFDEIVPEKVGCISPKSMLNIMICKPSLTPVSVITRGKILKNVTILKCCDYFLNHCEKCIQISTNMPSTGLVICEIGFEFHEIWEKNSFFHGKIDGKIDAGWSIDWRRRDKVNVCKWRTTNGYSQYYNPLAITPNLTMSHPLCKQSRKTFLPGINESHENTPNDIISADAEPILYFALGINSPRLI